MSDYTQRGWDRVVGWGKVPQEYKMASSEDMLILRVFQNELYKMEAVKGGKYTDEEMVVIKYFEKRIKILEEEC